MASPFTIALASQFVVCDHWFASIPTDTFPNRLYAMSGGADGLLTTPSDASVAGSPPAYTRKTIFEFLQEHGADWNIFFSDLPFALVFAALAQDAKYTSRMLPVSEFVVSAATGELPAVAWIDPNFNDVPDGSDNASDDHPPGDVARGQQFIARIYDAIATSPAWSKSMLVITYDEHGGFYDHVLPAGTPPHTDGPKDDDPNLTRYGVRVPAIVVSPWVPQAQASHTIFDHTSILRTILLRFCTTPMRAETGSTTTTSDTATSSSTTSANTGVIGVMRMGGTGGLGSVTPSMGARTDTANNLGPLLSLDSPRKATPIAPVIAALSPSPVRSPRSPALAPRFAWLPDFSGATRGPASLCH